MRKSAIKINGQDHSKLKDSARYISMMFVLNPKRLLKDSVYPIYTLLALPIGWLVYIRKFKNAK